MWLFGRKRLLAESGIFQEFTDWHTHILPGVDNRVRTKLEALDILALYETLGVKAVWLTPHVMEDVPNTTTGLKECFDELKAAYDGNIRLHLSAEYMLDNLFKERLNENDMLSLGERGDILLMGTSCYNPTGNLHGILDEIKSKGFYPVLAHPERYTYMEKKDYRILKRAGVRFQLNLFFQTGLYGKKARTKVRWLSKKVITIWQARIRTERKCSWLAWQEKSRLRLIL